MSTLKERIAALNAEERAELAAELGTSNSNPSDLLKTIEAIQAELITIKKHVGIGEKPPKEPKTVSVWDKFFGPAQGA